MKKTPKDKKMFNFAHARNKRQIDKMLELKDKKICPFCSKYLERYHDQPIEKVGKYWSVTKNDYPYAGTKGHFLLIYSKHTEKIENISKNAWAELGLHIHWLIKKYNLPAGGLAFRFGDSDYTGATISHLHAHLISGYKRRTKNKEKIINFPIGYKK